MKITLAVFMIIFVSATSYAQNERSTYADQCQELQYREQRRAMDQLIEDLAIQLEFTVDSVLRDQLALKILQLETERTNLVRKNMACWWSKLW